MFQVGDIVLVSAKEFSGYGTIAGVLTNNGRVVRYNVRTSTGKVMQVKPQSIKEVIDDSSNDDLFEFGHGGDAA